MRIVLNPAFEAFSGKIGEIQYSDTKYGQVGGKAATKNDPKTPAQRKQRGALGRSSIFYGALDLEHVEMWRDYAKSLRWTDKKSGAKFTPDPIAVYNSLADRWLGAHGGAGTPPSVPPTTGYAVADLGISAIATANLVTFYSNDECPSGTTVEFWLQRLPKATRLPSKGGYRVVGYSTMSVSGGTEFEVPVKPGVYAAQYRYINLATGQATELVDVAVAGVALAVEQGGAAEKPAARKKAA